MLKFTIFYLKYEPINEELKIRVEKITVDLLVYSIVEASVI